MTACTRNPNEPAAAPAVPEDPAIVAARRAWRQEQDRELRAPLSPLARIDYVHLPVGEHLIAADAPPLNLPASALGPYLPAGRLRLRVEAGRFEMAAEPALPRNGNLTSQSALANGDVLTVGRIRLLVAGLPEDPALAVYDPQAEALRAYHGLKYYPDDGRYVTRARLERYAEPHTVRVQATRGSDKTLQAIGVLRFEVAGHKGSMEAYSEGVGSDRLFLIFKDKTNGQPDGSYGAGRYLYARLGGDEVTLDFNQAWSPLCAYSPYFHCPIPPQKNWQDFPIPVGEKSYHGDH